VQAALNLLRTSPETGGNVLVPSSHRAYKELAEAFLTDGGAIDYARIALERPEVLGGAMVAHLVCRQAHPAYLAGRAVCIETPHSVTYARCVCVCVRPTWGTPSQGGLCAQEVGDMILWDDRTIHCNAPVCRDHPQISPHGRPAVVAHINCMGYHSGLSCSCSRLAHRAHAICRWLCWTILAFPSWNYTAYVYTAYLTGRDVYIHPPRCKICHSCAV
jgi:hypothetical protein